MDTGNRLAHQFGAGLCKLPPHGFFQHFPAPRQQQPICTSDF